MCLFKICNTSCKSVTNALQLKPLKMILGQFAAFVAFQAQKNLRMQ